MIENRHLKIIQALDQQGTLTAAANTLCLSQSALSHQIRYLEKKLGVDLWQRDGRKLRLTQAGQLLLQTALQVLPILTQTEKTLKAYGEGRQGILRIGVECYPCYQWLSKVIGIYLNKMPDVDIEIIQKFQFSGLAGLLNHHIDILVTPDIEKRKHIDYEPVMEYELVLLVAKNHPLADFKIIKPTQFSNETLLVFPVSLARLDIFNLFLNPAYIQPKKIKKLESVELMVQMVAAQRGICVLPQWLASSYCEQLPLKSLRLGQKGIHKQLFLALRHNEQQIAYMGEFIQVCMEQAE